MLLTVLRRFVGNRWKTLSMLAGLILALAMAFGVPMYSDAILQRMLNKTFEDQLLEKERYPAYLSLKYEMSSKKKDALGIKDTLGTEFNQAVDDIGLPVKVSGMYSRYSMLFRNTGRTLAGKESLVFYYVQDIEDHITISTGRMYNPDRNDGVVEAIVRQTALVNSDMTLGEVYEVKSSNNSKVLFKMEIVGIFEATDNSEYFWFTKADRFGTNIFIDNSYMESLMAADENATRHATQYLWYAALDYEGVNVDGVPEILDDFAAHKENCQTLIGKDVLSFNAVNTFETINELSSSLYMTLISLLVPLFVIIAFYVIMIADMKLKSERNEISVMQSRGAGRGHILLMYLMESAILVGVSAVIGPFLGIGLCKLIGASNGFMTFVNRKSLPLTLVPESFIALGIVAALFIVITMIPAFLHAGVNVVQNKHKKREVKIPFYHKYFLDFLCIGLGLYGWYSMRVRMLVMESNVALTLENTDITMYISGTVFALGAGMLFLRLYPYLLRFVFSLGKRFWPAWAYFTLNRASRNRECASIMLFMILTLSIGTVSADTARSINRYVEKNIEVEMGADAVYMPRWKKYDEEGNLVIGTTKGNVVEIYDGDILVQSFRVSYPELLTNAFEDIEEIESIARVFRQEDITVKRERGQAQGVDAMLIDPYEFATTANWPADFGYFHLNEYANALMKVPYGCIVSTALMEEQKLELGEKLVLIVGSGNVECTIIGAVDAWPGLDRYTLTPSDEVKDNYFIIAKLNDYISTNEVLPYEFFIKKADGVSDMELYNALAETEAGVSDLASTGELLTDAKNSPVLQGTNGMLTVSFIASVALCAAGFMVYWVIAIRERQLQFGISRALGVSRMGVMLMLALEQVLISGASIVAGIFIGRIQSGLFVPFLAMNYTEEMETAAFRVVTSVSDLGRILGVLGAVLAVCLVILFTIVIRLKVDRALKLGED
ncbi:MAG: ABC transporter permease [Clostridia bacterium]|nr:ABC transporter permease [Clostridia bacterium]